MNGAESLVHTLINNGVEVCFTNPGTSEMHMVSALGRIDGMRGILSLFEGVCSGAADGYGRIAGKPACTLLHLGPGLSNASANIHNARKASSPMINLIGDHATYHKALDAPLTSDIISLANPVSHWVKSVATAEQLPHDAVEAVQAAMHGAGQVSTLIVPADCAWNDSVDPLPGMAPPPPRRADAANVKRAAELLGNGNKTVILLSNLALSERALALADSISQKSGATVFCDTFTRNLPRGEGRARVERLGYFAEQATEQFAGVTQYIMVGTKAPVAFFAYPGKPSEFYAPGSTLHTLSSVNEDAEAALEGLAAELGANAAPRLAALAKPDLLEGALTPDSIGRAVANYLTPNSIVVDEAATSGGPSAKWTAGAEPHDWISLTGGSIGFGLPTAIGASVARPNERVVCLHGDGGAMYTIQALWTMARENLPITVVIFANRKYQILQVELARVGAQSMNKKTLDLLDIDNPELDFTALARGMGVHAERATTAEEFNKQMEDAMQSDGPRLIEAIL